MGGYGKTRPASERFDLMEKAVTMSADGHTREAIAKSLEIGRSTLDRWKTLDDWKDITRDVVEARRNEERAVWRGELKTAVQIAQRIANEGDPNNAVMLDTMKFIVDSLELGPKGESNGNTESSTPPINIQINATDRAALDADLRRTLGDGDNSLDPTEE